MRDDLLEYYNRELSHLRQNATLFAQKYPKVASRLILESVPCEDPHVERLLEGFAYLAARVHLKVDDDFPELTQALLNVVYPHFIRPVPSMSIVEFQLGPQGKLAEGLRLERGAMLLSRPVNGVPCKFRTGYDTHLWPITVAAAECRTPDRLKPPLRAPNARAAIRLQLQSPAELPFSVLSPNRLRFYLSGESQDVHTLYELLFCKLEGVVLRDATPGSMRPPLTLPPSCLQPVGFGPDEGLLPYPRRSFLAYRLLQEFFAFPEKFFFLDLVDLAPAWASLATSSVEVIFLLAPFEGEDRWHRLETNLTAETFRLGCTPIVNLFPQTAEPILANQQRYEYPLVPDVRRPYAVEVFSVDEVTGIHPQTRDTIHYEPFYATRFTGTSSGQQAFWTMTRRPTERPDDDGTDVFLSTVDPSLRPAQPASDTLHVRTTCTNRDLPARLPFGNEAGDFELDRSTPVQRILTLKKPTAPLRPPLGRDAQWRLLSHLSLNHLSLVEEGRDALRSILALYNFTDSPFAQNMIDGIAALRSEGHFARVISPHGVGFARGAKVEMTLDESRFEGGGAYLFSAVIERFLGHYASLNSFSQLSVGTTQRKELLRVWPPRSGSKILL